MTSQGSLPGMTGEAGMTRSVCDVAFDQLPEAAVLCAPAAPVPADWAQALLLLGADDITEAATTATLGTLLKYREDQQRVEAHGVGMILEALRGRIL